jgi:hypothetical protein
MTDDRSGLTRGFEFQIMGCEVMGSRFSADVLRIILADIEAAGRFAALVEPWMAWSEREVIAAAAPLRLLGGLHHLVLRGLTPALAAQYPPAAAAAAEPAVLRAELLAAARVHAAFLAEFIRSPPQTNEVRRSLCLIGGFLTVARETGLALRCLEIGASAGLNLNWDRYRYDLGPLGAWGDPASPVRLDGEWVGAPPPFDVAAEVAERAGCDRAPIDVADSDQALRLQAFVWADQPDRMARLRAAIALARGFAPAIAADDAGAWALRMAPPRPGLATVLFHSVVWTYLSDETRAAIRRAIRHSADQASAQAPFAWLRMEPRTADPAAPMELRLTLWPGGEERALAHVHPHGAKVLWLGA